MLLGEVVIGMLQIIQQANLEAIERANRKTLNDERTFDGEHSKLIGPSQSNQDDRLHLLANEIEHRFNDIVPYLNRINPLIQKTQTHQDLITQGMGVINKI